MKPKSILYLTDLSYPAKGRIYSEEDIYITNLLKDCFDVVLCHPKCAERFEDSVDLIVFRNTGSIIGYKEIYLAFADRVRQKGLKTFNTFTGKADMLGKQYLLDLTAADYPVIPTVDSTDELHLLPAAEQYVIKPKDGADSIGLEFISKEELSGRDFSDREWLIQPAIDFVYEVSFYFINDKLEYALYAPDKAKRWELKAYPYTDEDAAFARKFIAWNTIEHGIQRVDACRTRDGRLLLVELEDLNPYLSLPDVGEETRKTFMRDFIHALQNA